MSFLKNKKKKNYFELITLFFLIVFIIFGVKYFIRWRKINQALKIRTTMKIGKAKYFIFIAKTTEQKKRGLMFVKKLPANYGMLFVFKKKVDYPFWMKNTLIPLTALFINKGTVINQVDMKPCKVKNCTRYFPFVYYKYALEINKTNKKFIGKKVKIGDLL